MDMRAYPQHQGNMVKQQPPSTEDWCRYQSQIEKLYLFENKALREVLGIMEREHHFKASIKMYKNRITNGVWTGNTRNGVPPLRVKAVRPVTKGEGGGRSTSTEPESAIATAIHQFSTAAPSPSAGELSPTVVPIYLKDLLPPRTRALAEPVEHSPLTPDVAIQSPTILETVSSFDQIRSEIFDYFWTSFESKAWISEGIDTYCRSAKARPGVRDVISSFKNSLITACNDDEHGILYMLKGSSKIKDIVVAESPEMIADLIELSFWLIKRQRYEIVRIILQHFSEMSEILTTKSRAIYRSLARCSTSESYVFEQVAFTAWRLIVDQFKRRLGSLRVTTLRCHLGWLTYFADTSVCDSQVCLSKCEHAEYSERILWGLLGRCDEAGGSNSAQSEMVLQALVNVLIARRSYADVEIVGEEIYRRAQIEHGNRMLFMALKSISEAQIQQHRYTAAEGNLRKLVDTSVNTWGWYNSKTVHYMFKLENCLMKQEKVEAVEEIRARRVEAARRLERDIPILD